MTGYWNAHSDRDWEGESWDEWIECDNCGGTGLIAGCFEDTCSCTGDPEDPEDCCAPSRCDVCHGKCGWERKP